MRYWTRKRIESRAPFGVPGIEARMPIASGCLAVSHTLTVAHGSGSFLRADAPAGNSRAGDEDGNQRGSQHAGKRI